MLSHQPEVTRVLHAEHVLQLALSAAGPHDAARVSSRPVRKPSRLGVVAQQLPTRT